MAQTRQPGMGANNANPFFQPTVEWGHGLCDCCSDMQECKYSYHPHLSLIANTFLVEDESLCAWCCGCCFMQDLAKKINEDALCGCCIPSRLAVYRMKIRTTLKIQGTAMDDCCKATWCGLCTAVQMKLELKDRNLA
ncbi:unnamed protein product [Adineta ricciae]|uniref:Cornifelin-like protein n=1 Tax=Adineta ricciae TaxID=249248 RepID=A0A814XVG3_ADIRI|nr:unnamed protein product [Adineta ricciae]